MAFCERKYKFETVFSLYYIWTKQLCCILIIHVKDAWNKIIFIYMLNNGWTSIKILILIIFIYENGVLCAVTSDDTALQTIQPGNTFSFEKGIIK